MSRLVKWSLPVLAFSVIVALATGRAGAQEAADEGAAAASGKVTGTIHNQDGTPAANVTVRLVTPPSKRAKKTEKESESRAADEDTGTSAEGEKPAKERQRRMPVAEGKTDGSGKFELEAPAGKYTIMAMLRGQGRTQKTIEIKAGETKDVGTLTLKKPAPKKEKEAAPASP